MRGSLRRFKWGPRKHSLKLLIGLRKRSLWVRRVGETTRLTVRGDCRRLSRSSDSSLISNWTQIMAVSMITIDMCCKGWPRLLLRIKAGDKTCLLSHILGFRIILRKELLSFLRQMSSLRQCSISMNKAWDKFTERTNWRYRTYRTLPKEITLLSIFLSNSTKT